MSIVTQVSFVRNLLCVIKALLPPHHALMQPVVLWGNTSAEVSSIEYCIALGQLGAVIFGIDSGIRKLYSGAVFLRDFQQRKRELEELMLADPSPENVVLSQTIESRRMEQWDSIVSGFCDLIIAFAFVMLMLNSLHIRSQTHPKPVIDAILASEIPLCFYLYLLLRAFWRSSSLGPRLQTLGKLLLEEEASSDRDEVSSSSILLTIHEAGFQGNISSALVQLDPVFASSAAKIQPLPEDLKAISSAVNRLVTKERSAKAVTARLLGLATYFRSIAVMDLIFFLLNVLAWYGYLVAALTFYIPEQSQPLWFALMKLQLPHATCDWWGNFLGDLAWTIEPFLLLVIMPALTKLHVDSNSSQRSNGAAVRKLKAKKKADPKKTKLD